MAIWKLVIKILVFSCVLMGGYISPHICTAGSHVCTPIKVIYWFWDCTQTLITIPCAVLS